MNRRKFFTGFGAAAAIAPVAVLLPSKTIRPTIIEGAHITGPLTLTGTHVAILNCHFEDCDGVAVSAPHAKEFVVRDNIIHGNAGFIGTA